MIHLDIICGQCSAAYTGAVILLLYSCESFSQVLLDQNFALIVYTRVEISLVSLTQVTHLPIQV